MSAAVDVDRDLLLCAVGDDLFDLLLRVGIEHRVRHVFDDLVAQPEQVVHGFAVCNGQPRVIVRADELAADDGAKRGRSCSLKWIGRSNFTESKPVSSVYDWKSSSVMPNFSFIILKSDSRGALISSGSPT
jgi:hypothetical protein